MPLRTFIWNGLYHAQLSEQINAKMQIKSHYKRMGIENNGVTHANVWYAPSFNASPLLTTCGETGWHGKSGATKQGSHITVHFEKVDDSHFKMHQVYWTDEAYNHS
jgi:hypothetical protein